MCWDSLPFFRQTQKRIFVVVAAGHGISGSLFSSHSHLCENCAFTGVQQLANVAVVTDFGGCKNVK